MRILHRGSNGGYSLVDAALSLFIAGVVLLAVCAVVSQALRFSRKTVQKIDTEIQSENASAEKVFSNAE
jgi:hypothetical protein